MTHSMNDKSEAIRHYSEGIEKAKTALSEAQGKCASCGDSFLAEELGDLITAINQTALDVERFHAKQSVVTAAWRDR